MGSTANGTSGSQETLGIRRSRVQVGQRDSCACVKPPAPLLSVSVGSVLAVPYRRRACKPDRQPAARVAARGRRGGRQAGSGRPARDAGGAELRLGGPEEPARRAPATTPPLDAVPRVQVRISGPRLTRQTTSRSGRTRSSAPPPHGHVASRKRCSDGLDRTIAGSNEEPAPPFRQRDPALGADAQVELEVAATAAGVEVEPAAEAALDERAIAFPSFSTRRSACCFVSAPSSTARSASLRIPSRRAFLSPATDLPLSCASSASDLPSRSGRAPGPPDRPPRTLLRQAEASVWARSIRALGGRPTRASFSAGGDARSLREAGASRP
jgi:hypothetical protein